MMLALLASAAVAQAAPPAATPPTPAERQRQLECPSTGRLIARSASQVKNAFHTLNQEPDAAMIKPVARNYCEPSDVVRTNVSDRTPRPTTIPTLPRIAR